MNLMRSVLIAALAVGLLLGGGRGAAAFGGYATSSNPCIFSAFPYYRCNAYGCWCSVYGPAGPCTPSRPYLLCTGGTADGQCRCSATNPQLFLLPFLLWK